MTYPSGSLDDLASLLDSHQDQARPLLRALFGTDDAGTVADVVEQFVADALSPVSAARFVRSGVGLVVGLELEDGRAVVVKIHRWNASVDRLTAIQRVQESVADRGLPAPRPLVAPTPLGDGIATIEEYRSGGPADGHSPAIRRSLAGGLARFVAAANTIEPLPSVGTAALTARRGDSLWGEPHDLRFDFDRTAAGAEWIDELARTARAALADADLPDVVAHLDWRVENLGFDDTELVAIYDWDSVGLASEPIAVGQAAAQFSTDWRVGHATLPSVAEMRAFVADYEDERGRPFTDAERTVVDAANLLLCAYGARCEHSDQQLHPDLAPPADTGWRALLRHRSTESLD